jgi:hypothetical protein
MQHQCSAALVMAKLASLLFGGALQNRLTARLCHCSYTYGNLPFIQACSDATPKHSSTEQTASLLFSAAQENRVTACLCHCRYTCGDLHFKQMCSDAILMHCSTGQIAFLLFSATLEISVTAGTVSLQLHLWRFAVHIGVQ